ncbi:MAG: hypothetical protein DPW11_02435 [bacterium]|nr:hypothetical protein [Candidatus Microgenomates bacterium CPR3]MCQ3944609.1 hypothetical protein [bacterium]RIK52217.1 MAG: hypothetical protein DCC61_00310 [Candidatus Microgenomates bacterium]
MNKKFFIIAFSISIFILILILIISPRKTTPPLSSPPPEPTTTQLRAELTNLTEEKVKNAINYRKLVQDRFPIYLKDFKTSVGITTTINIYSLSDDDPSLMRLEIYGLSYLHKDELDPKKNPNIIAFAESYARALSLIRESGADPTQFIFSYGDRTDIHTTATYWVEQLDLLR